VLVVEVDDLRWQVEVDPLPTYVAVAPGDTLELAGELVAPVAYPFQQPRQVTIEARMAVLGQRAFGTGVHHRLVHTGRTPPRVTRHPADAVAPINGTAVFSVEAADPTGASFQWRRNTAAIVDDHRHRGASTPVLQVSGIGFDALGDYDCLVTNSAGSIASLPGALTLAGPPIRRPGDRVPAELAGLIRRWSEFRRGGTAASAGAARRPPAAGARASAPPN